MLAIQEACAVVALHDGDFLEGLADIGFANICSLCLSDSITDGECSKCKVASSRVINAGGYVVFQAQVTWRSKQKLEHVLIAERAIGKPLPAGVVVHHHDRNKKNNANTNLVICENAAYHSLLHARMRLIERGANPDTEGYCTTCKSVLSRSHFLSNPKTGIGLYSTCKPCRVMIDAKNYAAGKRRYQKQRAA